MIVTYIYIIIKLMLIIIKGWGNRSIKIRWNEKDQIKANLRII